MMSDKAMQLVVIATGVTPLRLSHVCSELAKHVTEGFPASDVLKAGLRLMAAEFNEYGSRKEANNGNG